MNTMIKSLLTIAAASLVLASCDKLPNNGVDTGTPGDMMPGTMPSGMMSGMPSSMPSTMPSGVAPTTSPSGSAMPTAMPSNSAMPTAMPTDSAMPTAMPSASASTAPSTGEFVQIERLARPAINEGLIRQEQNELLNTWNMVAPSVDLTSAAKPIADEATMVLKALGNTDDQVNGLFKALLPDVMRIDTTHTSGYAGSAPGMLDNVTSDLRPIGGRMIKDDVIDVTLSLIVPGGAPSGTAIAGLESDNVTYDGPNANGKGHKPVTTTFPYLADPNM